MLRPKPPWLQALFPWEHQALRVNGRTMAYLDEGPAEANAVDLRHSLMRASDVKGCIHEQLNQDMR